MANYANPYYEVAIAGTEALDKAKELNAQYLPNILVVGTLKESKLPLLENRFNKDDTYIYVCVNGTCKIPKTKVKEAILQLR